MPVKSETKWFTTQLHGVDLKGDVTKSGDYYWTTVRIQGKAYSFSLTRIQDQVLCGGYTERNQVSGLWTRINLPDAGMESFASEELAFEYQLGRVLAYHLRAAQGVKHESGT